MNHEKPTCGIQTLQILHGQFWFPFSNYFFELKNTVNIFGGLWDHALKFWTKICQVFSTMENRMNHSSQKLRILPYIITRLILNLKISLIWFGDMLFIVLSNSVTRFCMFLSWIETELHLCSNSSNDNFLSTYIIRKHFSIIDRLWRIHKRGQ